jgi:hypothetical protein
MRRTRILLGLVLVVASVLAVVARAAGDDPPSGFRLPDASAACRMHHSGREDATLVCRSLSVRTGVEISGRGSPRSATEPIWWDASTPVLERWHSKGVSCAVQGGQIACVNAAGNSISAGPPGIAASL